MPGASSPEHERLMRMELRIHAKMDDYDGYNFTAEQSEALNIFFDLAQEFEDVRDLYAVCSLIPKIFFGLDSNLYILDRDNVMRLSWSSCIKTLENLPGGEEPCCALEPIIQDNRMLLPIKGNRDLISQLPFEPRGSVIGLLEIFPADQLSPHDQLFFEKYANRIGFQLHNRMIGKRNREHIQFIRTLVEDIGHNVIVPNMYFKLFYRRLESKIKVLKDVIDDLQFQSDQCSLPAGPEDVRSDACGRIRMELEYVYEGLWEQYQEIYRHYEQTSLYLETLLRRSHFEQGRYVLDKRTCNIKSQIIDPQISRFRSRMEERGIAVDTALGGVPDQEIQLVADVGLISQVYTNLFSNAIKYAREVEESGKKRKFIAYGWETIDDFFGPGLAGLKLNVFSTGPRIPEEEVGRLFVDGFRGRNAEGEYGTGHGLFFVKEVVELHGGVVGYEPTQMGNNFYFILPLESGSTAAGGSESRTINPR